MTILQAIASILWKRPKMRTLSADSVRGLAFYLSQVYKSTYVCKATAVEMQAIAGLLGALGIVDSGAFMREFSTTIGRRVYLPFVVGSDELPLFSQVRVLVHEHQHVVQQDREGAERFAFLYLSDKNYRATMEAEAYSTAFTLEKWFGTPLDSPEYLAAKLTSYGLGAGEIAYAAGILRSLRTTVESGGRILQTHAVDTAIDWLQTNT